VEETKIANTAWWTWSGSNRRPLPCHGSALPAAPQAHIGGRQLLYSRRRAGIRQLRRLGTRVACRGRARRSAPLAPSCEGATHALQHKRKAFCDAAQEQSQMRETGSKSAAAAWPETRQKKMAARVKPLPPARPWVVKKLLSCCTYCKSPIVIAWLLPAARCWPAPARRFRSDSESRTSTCSRSPRHNP
jgi:hypothetical protein